MSAEPMEQFLKSLCEHAGIAIIATDDRLLIRFWNDAAARLFGHSAAAALGQPIWLIIPPDRHGLAQRTFDRALARAETSEFDIRYPGPQDRACYLAVTVSPVLGENRRVVGVSICVRDVTKGMELLRDVAETQRMSALSSMAGAVAHYFNNLLGGAMTVLDFVQDAADAEVLRRALRTVISALGRVSALTYGLSTFAEGDHSETPVANVTDIVRDYLAQKEEEWLRLHVVLEADLDSIDVAVPLKRLITVLDVLTTNACEAMFGGGALRVELKPGPGDTFVLRVADTGAGVPQEQVRHVFEPFFTTKRALETGQPEHTGLGLAIVHGIIKDLDGTVTLQQGKTGGTVCTICLPRPRSHSR
jgi:two-component system, cell cycle sensor histidine kinase and response regulator CckA